MSTGQARKVFGHNDEQLPTSQRKVGHIAPIAGASSSKHKGVDTDQLPSLYMLDMEARADLNQKINSLLFELVDLRWSKKSMVLADLLNLELMILDWFVNAHCDKLLSNDEKQLVSKGKITSSLTFLQAWWFCTNELIVPCTKNPSFNLYRYWEEKFPEYKAPPGKLLAADDEDPNQYVVGSPQSLKAATKLSQVMYNAAKDMIAQFHIDQMCTSPHLLLDALGFLATVLRLERNVEVQFLESLFHWSEAEVEVKKRKRGSRARASTSSWQQHQASQEQLVAEHNSVFQFPHAINLWHVDEGIKRLEMLSGPRLLLEASWNPLEANANWFSTALLGMCKKTITDARARASAKSAAQPRIQ
ncbi:hypothetical protein GOP47_0030516 [Adiantum capillus-veneris]|nr:hypothetical protein GOP47_0030516 [Adiantum capillus-veneris]